MDVIEITKEFLNLVPKLIAKIKELKNTNTQLLQELNNTSTKYELTSEQKTQIESLLRETKSVLEEV